MLRYWCILFFVWNVGQAIAGENSFRVRPLPYSYKGLEPHLSRTTVESHHKRHYRHSVNMLNQMVLGIDRLHNSTSLEEIMMDSHEWNKPLYRRAAESWNHDFYFKCMTMNYVPPSDTLLEQIERDFGSFAQFRLDFRKAGNSIFGSGWAWVVYDVWTEALEIRTTTGGDNPITIHKFLRPVLAMDMWEHAYISDFKSKRDYTKTFVTALVDWKFVEETLVKVKMDAARTREELERKQLEANTKAAALKAEMLRLTAQVVADVEQAELATMEMEGSIDEEKQGNKESTNGIEGVLKMAKDSVHGVDRFQADPTSEFSETISTTKSQVGMEFGAAYSWLDRDIGSADLGGPLHGDDQQSIVVETVFGTSLDSWTTSATAHDLSGTMTVLEDREALGGLNEALDNTTFLGRAEVPNLEAVSGIKGQERVGVLSFFFRGATTMGSGVVGYLWSLLGSRKTKEADSDADKAANESSTVTGRIPASIMNMTDDPGEVLVASYLPEEVAATPTPEISESREETNENISGPTNPLSKTLSFVWNIICSLFRFLRFIWSLG